MMLLQNKVAVIFGGSGAVGRAIAQSMAQEGAHLWLAGRDAAKLAEAAAAIRTNGGAVETFTVDVLDEHLCAARIAERFPQRGGIDIVVNACAFRHNQGKGLLELSLAEFRQGFDPCLTAQLTIAKAVVPKMGGERPGVLLTVIAPAGPLAIPGHLGHIVGCAGTEAFIKALASEVGAKNIRVLGVRSHAMVDAVAADSLTTALFVEKAQALGLSVEAWLEGAAGSTMLQRLPTRSQVADTLTFLASDRAGAMTATIVNITAGMTLS